MGSYKYAYDILSSFDLGTLQIIAYIVGIPITFGMAPAIYKYFRTLLYENEDFINANLRKHFFPVLIILIVNLVIVFMLDYDLILKTLNGQFRRDPSFTHNIFTMVLFMTGTPLLVFQWLFYYLFLKRLISRQRALFGKYYGSYEQRNEQLIKRIYFSFTTIFISNFLITFFQIKNPLYIIALNLISGLLMVAIVMAAREQVEVRSYRMYKLSSHEEEVSDRIKQPEVDPGSA